MCFKWSLKMLIIILNYLTVHFFFWLKNEFDSKYYMHIPQQCAFTGFSKSIATCTLYVHVLWLTHAKKLQRPFFFFVVGGIWCRKFVFITLTDYYNLTHFMGTFPSPFSDHGQIHDTCTWNGQKTPSLYTAVKFTRKLVIMVLTQESVL